MLRKKKKSSLHQELEKLGTPVDKLAQNSGCIIDGKNFVQKIKGNNRILCDISMYLLMFILVSELKMQSTKRRQH